MFTCLCLYVFSICLFTVLSSVPLLVLRPVLLVLILLVVSFVWSVSSPSFLSWVMLMALDSDVLMEFWKAFADKDAAQSVVEEVPTEQCDEKDEMLDHDLPKTVNQEVDGIANNVLSPMIMMNVYGIVGNETPKRLTSVMQLKQ